MLTTKPYYELNLCQRMVQHVQAIGDQPRVNDAIHKANLHTYTTVPARPSSASPKPQGPFLYHRFASGVACANGVHVFRQHKGGVGAGVSALES